MGKPIPAPAQGTDGRLPARRERARANPLMRIALGLVVLLCLVGGYRYLVSGPENRGRIEGHLSRALKTRGLDVAVRMGRDGAVTATGIVERDADKKAALAIIRSHGDVKAVVDAIEGRPLTHRDGEGPQRGAG